MRGCNMRGGGVFLEIEILEVGKEKSKTKGKSKKAERAREKKNRARRG